MKFHNVAPVNGRAMTMEDAIYSYERQRALETNALFISDIDSWQAVDANTLRLKLKNPSSDFLCHFASTFNKIVSREMVDKFGDLKTAEAQAGKGPFMAKSLTPTRSEIIPCASPQRAPPGSARSCCSGSPCPPP